MPRMGKCNQNPHRNTSRQAVKARLSSHEVQLTFLLHNLTSSLPKPWKFLLEWCPESLQGLSSLLHESRLLPLILDPTLLYLSRNGQVLLWILSFPLTSPVSNAVCSAQMFHQLYSFWASRAMILTNVLRTNLERTTRGPKQTGSSRIHSPTGQCLGKKTFFFFFF